MITIAELLQEKEKLKQAERQYRKQGSKPERKDYLSKGDREELIILTALVSKLEELLEIWYSYRRSKERIKYGKTALTFLYKAMDTYFSAIPERDREREAYRAIRELKQCHIYLERRA